MIHSSPGVRVLLVRVGAMGDVLHALPAAAAIRQSWPEAVIDWVVDPRWAPLLVDQAAQGPIVSTVHLADTRLWSRAPASPATLRSIQALRKSLRKGHYDFVIDVQGTLRSAVLGRFAGARHFAGFADPREAIAIPFYRQRFPRVGRHVVEQNTALLSAALGVPFTPQNADLPRSVEAEAWCDRELASMSGQRFALLAPGAGWGAKQWPAEHFGALARQLRTARLHVLVNASGPQDSLAAAVVAASADTAQPVHCDLAHLIALTRRAAVVVCGDSGPLHLAAALGTPCVGLFGPTDPARNGPWGSGPKVVLRHPLSRTSHKRVSTPDPGLASIAVHEVADAVQSVLDGETPAKAV